MPCARYLNRPLARPLGRFLNRRLAGRPGHPPDSLAQACRLLNQYLRLRRRAAKAEPHLFGPHAGAYYRDTLKLAAERQTRAAALDKIYGSSPPASPPSPSVWVERHAIPDANMKSHRQWFKKIYGA